MSNDNGTVIAAVTILVTMTLIGIAVNSALESRYEDRIRRWATSRNWTYHSGGGGPWISTLPDGKRGTVQWQVVGSIDTEPESQPVTIAYYWWRTYHTVTSPGQGTSSGMSR